MRRSSVSSRAVTRLANISNLNSVKTMLIAMQISLKYADKVFSKNQGNKNKIKRIGLYISRLAKLSETLHTDAQIDPEIFYRELKLASIAYVNLFYGATQEDRNAFLSSCMSDNLGNGIDYRNNLILLPSVMAENSVPIGKASFSVLAGVHKKSFYVIRQALKSAVNMELFRNSSAIGNGSRNTEKLNKSIAQIDGIVNNMHALMKDYDTVESKKLELIEEMYKIGEASGFPVDGVIESISMPYNSKSPLMIRK